MILMIFKDVRIQCEFLFSKLFHDGAYYGKTRRAKTRQWGINRN